MTKDKRPKPGNFRTDVTLLRKSGRIRKKSTAASLYFSYLRAGTFPVIDVECFWKACVLFLNEKLVYTVGVSSWGRVL